MKIAMVSLNPTVGDVPGNGQKIIRFTQDAIVKDCLLVIFPEMALLGYPPKDLIRCEIFLDRQNQVLNQLKRLSKKITIIVGGFLRHSGKGPPFQNVAFIFKNGQKEVYAKRLLPNYDVFDERRYFAAGQKPMELRLGKFRFRLSICEDMWFDEPKVKNFYDSSIKNDLAKMCPDFAINISASPFEQDKRLRRQKLFSHFTTSLKAGLIFVNQSGANDDLIFDGRTCVMDAQGRMLLESPGFEETLSIFDTDSATRKIQKLPNDRKEPLSALEDLRLALMMGIRDYVRKSGFSKVLLGLSGGVDSALVAQLAVEALGTDNVLGVLMPSRHSSRGSINDAKILAKNLGMETMTIDIESVHRHYEKIFKNIFGRNRTLDTTAQNIQSRIRGNLLMAISNNTGQLLLNTNNKSEMAMGYGTLYGDMCGALAVLSDLTKTTVYELARHMNPHFRFISREIMTKPPSAELKPNQKDSDTLPEYAELDPLLERWIEKEAITEKDFKLHKALLQRLCRNEYKRQQAPVGLKVTAKAFGSGRRYPVVMKM